MSPTWRGLPLAAVLLAACSDRPPGPSPDRMVPSPPQTRDASAPGQPSWQRPDAAADTPLAARVSPEPPERDPDAPKVRLTLTVLPVEAEVHWGRKKLGLAGRKPLQLERARNSGPVDVVIRANGFLPYHTRLFTDRDDTLTVRLVRPADARSLLGWKPTSGTGSGTGTASPQ
jgi:hypothetical protein